MTALNWLRYQTDLLIPTKAFAGMWRFQPCPSCCGCFTCAHHCSTSACVTVTAQGFEGCPACEIFNGSIYLGDAILDGDSSTNCFWCKWLDPISCGSDLWYPRVTASLALSGSPAYTLNIEYALFADAPEGSGTGTGTDWPTCFTNISGDPFSKPGVRYRSFSFVPPSGNLCTDIVEAPLSINGNFGIGNECADYPLRIGRSGTDHFVSMTVN